ncbi:energy-coupling factor transporter transmembrane component T [Peptoniphilus sp. oral taxon 386]|uniref:energy-coupling factor transporter transmembrane component T n=1 Tax=Peptoniphilus sp. oral taxon 386 TaxID=652713 RepID=UPI0001DA9A7C|nr:energy-coupling factor transporter transmembrane component T [Peptoniphilus sp. oral taxon 386]EFI41942.1 cobalt transport protein [Peptoniphilus sp. oral taxon 386 str. F0131]
MDRRLNPLSIILINAFIPVVNTLFPTSKAIFLDLAVALFILFFTGLYSKAIKAILYLTVFFGLYVVSLNYFNSEVIISFFRMTTLFVPCIIFAYLLITQYNSSEILSSLQKLKLPKIFIIGLTVTIRYIPTFRREFKTIKEAMSIRGVDFSIRRPIRTFEYLIVPQLFRCLSLSGELTSAGLTRGISAPNKRTGFFDRRFKFLDFLIFFILIMGYVLIIGEVI